jgi:DNA repair protein RadC
MTTKSYPTKKQKELFLSDAAVMPLTTRIREREDALIADALAILKRRVHRGIALNSPRAVREYLILMLAETQHEEFVVIFLDAMHRVITTETMFRGTLTQTSVYPREVVKACLAKNAHAVVFAHNHPSGVCNPSRADELLTSMLKRSLALVDVEVLDHIIVAGTETMSFAERGIL